MIARRLPIPAYDHLLKCSHTFNLLDARGAVGVTERAACFGTMRALAREITGGGGRQGEGDHEGAGTSDHRWGGRREGPGSWRGSRQGEGSMIALAREIKGGGGGGVGWEGQAGAGGPRGCWYESVFFRLGEGGGGGAGMGLQGVRYSGTSRVGWAGYHS